MKATIMLLGTLLVLTLAFELHCQEAYVVQLQVSDAETARETWDQLQTAKSNWEAVRRHIALQYLVVPADHPEAGDRHFMEQSITGFQITTTPGFSGFICMGSGGYEISCDDQHKLTPAEIDQQKAAREAQIKQDTERHDRIARERRVRRGFETDTTPTPDDPPKFQFSHDFRYIVPPRPETPASQTPLIGGLGWSTKLNSN